MQPMSDIATQPTRAFFAAILAAAVLLAVPSTAAAGWSDFTTVTELIVEGTDRGYARFSIPVNTEQCDGGSTYFRFDPSTDYGKTLLSVLMAAKLSGQTVRVLLRGCDDWNRPILLGVRLPPSP